VAACNQVTSVIVARELGVELGAFNIDVRAELDNSVLVFGVEGESNFSRLALDVVVETNADDATFEKLAREVERRCPLTRLFVGSGVDVVSAWRAAPLPAIARAG
jgi:putative redox protein